MALVMRRSLIGLGLLFRLCAAAGADVRQLGLPTKDLVYEPHTARIYASVPSNVPGLENRVVAIEPTTGVVSGSIFVGSEPGKLALSSDGQTLWVALDGAAALRAIDLPTWTVGPQL